MTKRIDTEEGSFRMRRGKLVRIPDEWVGNVTHPQTIRKRASKQPDTGERRNWNKQGKLYNRNQNELDIEEQLD